jgi:transposase
MTFLSLADACRRLGIDAKTLRRWLAHAQLPLQSHPRDGRKKGVSSEHLQLLARLHQRSLAPLSQQPPAPVPAELPPLPAEFLALPATLCALQAQIAAVQQQVADLMVLVQPHPPRPSVTTRSPHPGARGRKSPPTKASARSRPAASSRTKQPRPSVHVLPLIEYGIEGTYVVICPTHGLLSLQPDTPQWFAWLATLSSFRFVGKQGRLTAHREIERLPKAAWRAHRSIRSHTSNVHLGSTESLTIATLEQAAATLHAHLK